MSDPHSQSGKKSGRVVKKPGASSVRGSAISGRGARKGGGDPHDVGEDHTPAYAGDTGRSDRYPRGVPVCTTDEWERVSLSVGEVERVEGIGGGMVLLGVKLGRRRKDVWAEAAVGDEVVGRRVVVVDNLEAMRVRGRVFNGKAVTILGKDGEGLLFVDDVKSGLRLR